LSAIELVFHPEALAEYVEAIRWYASKSESVADRYEREVSLALERIADAPNRWPSHDDMHRKLLIRRFPYVLIYREFEGRVWIVAVAHGHRRPGYWKDRIGNLQ